MLSTALIPCLSQLLVNGLETSMNSKPSRKKGSISGAFSLLLQLFTLSQQVVHLPPIPGADLDELANDGFLPRPGMLLLIVPSRSCVESG